MRMIRKNLEFIRLLVKSLGIIDGYMSLPSEHSAELRLRAAVLSTEIEMALR